MLQIGSRCTKINSCFYHRVCGDPVPDGTHGTVVRIRSRYQNTPAAYNLYVVQFDGQPTINDNAIDHQYDESSLKASN